jgi:hypothetical protein
MKANQLRAWHKVTVSLVLAFLLGWLAMLTLMILPATAAPKFSSWSQTSFLATPLAATGVFTVTGSVVDQNGAPVEGVQVFAYNAVASVGTVTNSSGYYTLTLNAENFYDIVFNPPLGTGLAPKVERGIHAGQSVPLNVILLPGYSVSGTVYNATQSNVVSNVAIYAFSQDTYQGFGLPPTTVSGTYQISLSTGTWTLTFTPPPFSGLGPTQTTVILTNDLSLDIILPLGFTVRGQVKGNGRDQPKVEIFAQDPPKGGFGFSPTDLSGRYTGTLPAGNFDILFFAPPFSGFGSTVMTNVIGPPDAERNLTLPTGWTVSGTVGCGGGLANSFVEAQPYPPLSAGRFSGWGRSAGADGFYALALQSGVYTIVVSPPGSFAQRIVPMVVVTQDLTLNFDYDCVFLPIIRK